MPKTSAGASSPITPIYLSWWETDRKRFEKQMYIETIFEKFNSRICVVRIKLENTSDPLQEHLASQPDEKL